MTENAELSDKGSEEGKNSRERLEGRTLSVIRDVDDRLVFRFEFGPAILAQVLEKLDLLPTIPLESVTLEAAKYPGFYQLFRNGHSVYVGRTIRPVGKRLDEHRDRLRGRVSLSEMAVKFLFVEDLSLLALSEATMISYFQDLDLDEWGKLGFGSKAPGFGRAAQTSKWDAAFPSDLNIPVRAGVEGDKRKLWDLVSSIRAVSPIRLSIPRAYQEQFKTEHADNLDIPIAERPFIDWIALLEQHLAPGWSVRREAMTWYIVQTR